MSNSTEVPHTGSYFNTPGLWYLASPYIKYAKGTTQAYLDVSKQMALCLKNDIPVYCPIVHSHYVSFEEILEDVKTSHDFWLSFDKHYLNVCIGMIVTKMDGWDQSSGIAFEIDYMEEQGKPIIYCEFMEVPNVSSVETKSSVDRFTESILHGSEAHRDWLKEAAKAFNSNGKIPEVKS